MRPSKKQGATVKSTWLLITVLVGLSFSLLSKLAADAQEKSVVRFYLFYGEDCPHCHEVMGGYLPSLYEKYGDQIECQYLEVWGNTDNYLTFRALEQKLGVPEDRLGAVPALVIGDHVLIGSVEIPDRLETLIDEYLAQEGVDYLPVDDLPRELLPTLQLTQEIYIAYFEEAGCQNCARTNYDLHAIEERYPNVSVERFPMEEDESKLLNEWLCGEYGVPEEKRLSAPMLFVGEDVLIDREATFSNLVALIEKYASTGAKPTWKDFDPQEAQKDLVERFRSWGALVIVGAGLIDGLNPCAFATLVFFISYMTFTGRRGRDVLFVGIAFALGVFLTYLLVGVGVLKLVQSLEFFPLLGRWMYLITALLCVVLAVFTFRDFSRARQGQATEMTLKLPARMRRWINKVIRENAQARAFVAMALVTGFVVSLIELTCTGQVYLPTIEFVMTVPELTSRAFLYLVLYCVMFIAPLVVVFLLSYFGTTSEQMGLFIARHTATVKAVTALTFVALALWMTWALAPLFGIDPPMNWVALGGMALVIGVGSTALQLYEGSEHRRRRTRVRPKRKERRKSKGR